MRITTLRIPSRFFRLVGPALIVSAATLFHPCKAVGSQITVQITANVRLVSDPANVLNGAVHSGDTVTGTYTYDSTITDSNNSPNVGDYRYIASPDGVQLSVDGLAFQTAPTSVDFLLELVNDYEGRDNYVFHSYDNLFAVSGGGSNVQNIISWQLDDPTETALSSTALPATPPILSNWQSIFGLDISSQGNSQFLIRSDVTSAVLIPEPSSFVLLGLALAVSYIILRGKIRVPNQVLQRTVG